MRVQGQEGVKVGGRTAISILKTPFPGPKSQEKMDRSESCCTCSAGPAHRCDSHHKCGEFFESKTRGLGFH